LAFFKLHDEKLTYNSYYQCNYLDIYNDDQNVLHICCIDGNALPLMTLITIKMNQNSKLRVCIKLNKSKIIFLVTLLFDKYCKTDSQSHVYVFLD
jgi:hypothetical protein